MATATAQTINPAKFYTEARLPESDGKPMAETDRHRNVMVYVIEALEERFRAEHEVYVSGNIFLYYRDEDHELKSISPDVLLVKGVEKKQRRIYNMEVEHKAPEVVFEMTSPSTKTEDLGNKRFIYASLGVKEYYLFDPYGETLRPALRGFRLENGDYLPVVGTRMYSQALGLEIRLEDGKLLLYDRQTQEYLRSYHESEAARRTAEAARRAAEARAVAAETELQRLRLQLENLQSKA